MDDIFLALLKNVTLWTNIAVGVLLINLFTNGRYKIDYTNSTSWIYIYCIGYVIVYIAKVLSHFLYSIGSLEAFKETGSIGFLLFSSVVVLILCILFYYIFKKHRKYFYNLIKYSLFFIIFLGGIFYKVSPFDTIMEGPEENICLQIISILFCVLCFVIFLDKYSYSIYLDNFFIRTNIATRVDDSIYNKIKNHQWAQSEQEQIIKIKTYNDIIYSGVLLDEDMNNYFLSIGNVEYEKTI